MELAKSLAEWREQSPEQWLKAANRFLPGLVVAILILAIAYQLAGITWTLFDDPGVEGAPPTVTRVQTSPSGDSRSAGDYTVLEGWKPFGEPPDITEAPVVTETLDAPDTTLNLQLHGVNGYDDPEGGQAIIASGRGEQKLYYVGDSIDNGNGATLHSVYSDRVLLNRSGRLETLRLPRPDELVASAQAAGRPNAGRAPAPQPTANASSLRDVISQNASTFTDIVRPVPHQEAGQMIGFRLTPGRDRETFAAFGLEPGDVLTEVNGMILNDTQSAMQVFEALGETSMANLTVLRNGNPQVLVIDMSQIESLTENRQ